ncbi:hypothetical protein PN836_019385 [Ningiella sp. W23]|uniref:hypothetical protein n=1 Tax=Ningiella sp. W23 TaxID=3023715 RepID=UPI003757E89D
MKSPIAVMLVLACFGASASQSKAPESSSFACVDAKSFEINASCMSNKIEMNDAFVQSQKDFSQQIESGDNAMASLTIDPETLNIKVVAHKDAQLAKVEH